MIATTKNSWINQCFSKCRWGPGPDREVWGRNGYFSVKSVENADFLGAPAKKFGAGGPSGPDLLEHCTRSPVILQTCACLRFKDPFYDAFHEHRVQMF